MMSEVHLTAIHSHEMNLYRLFTVMCLCRQAVWYNTG